MMKKVAMEPPARASKVRTTANMVSPLSDPSHDDEGRHGPAMGAGHRVEQLLPFRLLLVAAPSALAAGMAMRMRHELVDGRGDAAAPDDRPVGRPEIQELGDLRQVTA